MKLKITLVYDNTAVLPALIPDWGWSCYIETGSRNLLFDTGGNGRILLENLKTLDIDPAGIDDIVISHPDFDHIGGLSHLLNKNSTATVHVPFSFRGIKYQNQIKYYKEPARIYDGIFLTGELASVEQSLALKTDKGLVLIIGCAHPGVDLIMETISEFGDIYAVIGGLHGFNKFSDLNDVTWICPTHCTRYKEEIKHLYPAKHIEGGAGKIISF